MALESSDVRWQWLFPSHSAIEPCYKSTGGRYCPSEFITPWTYHNGVIKCWEKQRKRKKSDLPRAKQIIQINQVNGMKLKYKLKQQQQQQQKECIRRLQRSSSPWLLAPHPVPPTSFRTRL